MINLPAAAKPDTTDVIAIVKAGKNQSAAKAFVQTVLSPKGQATLQAAGFGKPMSTAADRGASSRRQRRRAWAPALGRVAVAVGGTVVVAVVMTFLMLPIVALFTYQPSCRPD